MNDMKDSSSSSRFSSRPVLTASLEPHEAVAGQEVACGQELRRQSLDQKCLMIRHACNSFCCNAPGGFDLYALEISNFCLSRFVYFLSQVHERTTRSTRQATTTGWTSHDSRLGIAFPPAGRETMSPVA